MQRQLTQMLLDAPDMRVDKRTLCETLWGNKSNAEESLYTLVRRTKAALADVNIEIICNRGDSYELRINDWFSRLSVFIRQLLGTFCDIFICFADKFAKYENKSCNFNSLRLYYCRKRLYRLGRVGGCDGGLKKDAEASFWGPIQIRTGVNGFADRYLTTRPWNLVVSAKVAHLF